ncbi:MAG: electron transfer flavoprotein subunit alpha/FixB family protein [Paenibacillus sp.]|nr:electron transfer flavoprotein subunit alpha/FixB family protein [Paenibacillus sp.]
MTLHALVIGEQRNGALRQVTLEAITAARMLTGADGTVSVLLPVAADDTAAAKLSAAGASRIYVGSSEDAQLAESDTDSAFHAASRLVSRLQPDALVLGHTSFGRDIAPRLAAQLDTGQISDVIAIEPEQDAFHFTRPVYAGKAFEKRRFTKPPWVVTIRPNNFSPLGDSAAADTSEQPDQAEVEQLPSEPIELRTVIRHIVKRAAGKTDLAEAKIVVSGGRGVRSAEGFQPLAELADALNGAVGASRGACDAGYCDYAMQIGQTGKVVTPELYIACGISGAIQHLAGMNGSRVIVAINKDPEAPIFKVADYGIVGDLFEVVPLLTEQFKRLLDQKP